MDRQAVYQALADPTRRKILHLLSGKELPAGEIAQQFEVSWPTVSRHLSVLKSAELVTSRRSTRQVLYALSQEAITTVADELDSIGSTTDAAAPTRGLAGDATQQAQEVFRGCMDEARQMHAERVGTHHLLLAILAGADGTARAVLHRAGVSYEGARDKAVTLLGQGVRPKDRAHTPFEWACKAVISGATRGEAIKLGHRVVGTGAQLLALLDEVERTEAGPPHPGKAAQVLGELGIDLDRLRRDLLAEIDVAPQDEDRSALDPVLGELGSTYQLMWEMFVGLESSLDERFMSVTEELRAIKQQLADAASGADTAAAPNE